MTDQLLPLFSNHGRTYRENKFVYPVLSRRSGGILIGVNLNPDKICNFDCIYCQVDRRSEAETDPRRFGNHRRFQFHRIACGKTIFRLISSGACP